MKRVCAALATSVLLVGLLPSIVSADRVSRFSDRYAYFDCSAEFAGGFAAFGGNTSDPFGNGAFTDIWLDPAVPFEDPPAASGFTEDVDVADDGTTIEFHATLPLFDPDGNDAGEATLDATLTRTGDVIVFTPSTGKTNQKDRTHGSEEGLAGSATLSIPETDIEAECSGGVGEVDVMTTNPRAFVSANTGVQLDCFWETETATAGLFAIDDGFGFFADATLVTADLELGPTGSSGSVAAASMDVDIDLEDFATGDSYSATASATFTPNGSPVTSTLTSQGGRTRTTEQALEPNGTLEFSTGDEFAIDDENCDVRSFESHSTSEPGAGPKRAPAPVNDGPEDAIALHVGSRLNASNVGAAREPEIQLENCPEGFFDRFGNTLWYTIEGTGSPITIDTAGSNFDTLIAIYVATDPGFVEIGCIDDVEFDPVGSTFQAALTFDTGEGVTYYVQIGGYDFPFDEEVIGQTGRLRVAVR